MNKPNPRDTKTALALANRNLDQLLHMAWLSISQEGCTAAETVVICTQCNTEWGSLILELNPEAEKQAARIKARGESPISIMCMTVSDLSDFLEELDLDISLPPKSEDPGLANFLILSAGGHYLWLQLPPRCITHRLS